MCGEKVIYVNSETYLDVSLKSDITDRAITQAVCSFYQKSNHVIANYSMLDSFSRCKLHTSFCMSLYGSNCGITTVDMLKKLLLLGERQ